jgi:hypothetical protein
MGGVVNKSDEIYEELDKTANEILKETNLMIDDTYEAQGIKDVVETAEAMAFVDVSLEKDMDTIKTKYPSDKARDMAMAYNLSLSDLYLQRRTEYRAKMALVEKRKATITRLHEKRRDLMAYSELIRNLGIYAPANEL